MSYWKMGDRYAFITPRGKRGIVDKLSQVPDSAKKKTTGSTKKKSQKSSPKKQTKRRKTSVAKKGKKRSSGFKLPGGIGPKGIISGVLGLMLVPRVVPVQTPGQAKLATGLALRALKIGGGGPLAAVGIMEVVAELASGQIGAVLGGGNAGNSGRYDY